MGGGDFFVDFLFAVVVDFFLRLLFSFRFALLDFNSSDDVAYNALLFNLALIVFLLFLVPLLAVIPVAVAVAVAVEERR